MPELAAAAQMPGVAATLLLLELRSGSGSSSARRGGAQTLKCSSLQPPQCRQQQRLRRPGGRCGGRGGPIHLMTLIRCLLTRPSHICVGRVRRGGEGRGGAGRGGPGRGGAWRTGERRGRGVGGVQHHGRGLRRRRGRVGRRRHRGDIILSAPLDVHFVRQEHAPLLGASAAGGAAAQPARRQQVCCTTGGSRGR